MGMMAGCGHGKGKGLLGEKADCIGVVDHHPPPPTPLTKGTHPRVQTEPTPATNHHNCEYT